MLRSHYVRKPDPVSWEEIFKEATYWMNSNKVVPTCISTTFCHANGDGLVTIYYR